MDTKWYRTFRDRMEGFGKRQIPAQNAVPVSIKIRLTSGCFHREHSPLAYELIDKYLTKVERRDEFNFEEHESGPEILVYVAAATAGISLAKSIIDLVVAIFKSRSEGIQKGDKPSAPLELIVRRVQKDGEFKEEKILRIGYHEPIRREEIEKTLVESISGLVKEKKGQPAKKRAKSNTTKAHRAP